ncbi:hypothetical protein Q1695_000932 [Nippostrongylus brasiliensis]|nr:hypothetical protein Q1695_000932 [Nippostrongylus brasiliensis]
METTLCPTEPSRHTRQVYKLVLTGGPCGGKTTGQDRLATFFENIGWKVFTVPEAATTLLAGRVKFAELNREQTYAFQKDLLMTMLQMENTYIHQAKVTNDRNVLIICDRGGMDPSAYIDRASWAQILQETGIEEFDLLHKRYDQVVHLVTAADGAEEYYTLENNTTRYEGIEAAKMLDDRIRKAWLGHPYLDIVDNTECKNFEDKVRKMIQVVCGRTGTDSQVSLSVNSRKRKWLVRRIEENRFVKYEEFNIKHEFLLTDNPRSQIRIRSREQSNRSTYTMTRRDFHVGKDFVETRTQMTFREYTRHQTMRDKSRAVLHKQRRCFLVGNQYFNLDIYTELPPSANALQLGERLIFLETYTTKPVGEPIQLPDFLSIEKEITGQPEYSMYSMSKIPNADGENVKSRDVGANKDE